MKKIQVEIVGVITAKDNKGNPTTDYPGTGQFVYGNYIQPSSESYVQKQYGYEVPKINASFHTRGNISNNQYIKHNEKVYHVVLVLEFHSGVKEVFLELVK